MNWRNFAAALILIGFGAVWTALAIWSFDVAFAPYCPTYSGKYVEPVCPRGIDRAPN